MYKLLLIAIFTLFAYVNCDNNWIRFKIDQWPNNYDESIYYKVSINGGKEFSWGNGVKMYSDGNESCKNGLCVKTYLDAGYIDFSYAGKKVSHPNHWKRTIECAFWNPKTEKCLIKRGAYLMSGYRELPLE